jgi:hypothetical protein
MNFREGMRRLALLLGVAGAILGGFASCVELQTTLDQRARHNRFEQLANSDVVRQERKTFQAYDALAAKSGGKPVAPPSGFVPVPSEVNKGGIRTINWDEGFGVYSIETEDGQTLYPTPAPSEWNYLWVALFPVLGFFIPWGAVRAIGWVGVGFSQPSR